MFSRSVLSRLATAFVTAEVRRLRGAGMPALPAGDWPETMPIGEQGLGLDSLERLGAMGALAEAFAPGATHPDMAEPRTVGDWIDWIDRAAGAGARLSVTTSGSTGMGRACSHRIGDLREEAEQFATQFGDRRRVVAFVPGHHLYGLIWTILLPDALGIPVVSGSVGGSVDLRPGDLVVAVPEQWQALRRLTGRFVADVQGVSSAGTLPAALGADLHAAGLSRLVDVYGSSETGAIAVRELPATAYDLLPRWTLAPDEDDWQLLDRDGCPMPLPDHVERVGARALRPIGRRDGAVQVGGHNVWPMRVAAELRGVPGVADIAVRLGANGRLKAFVVPMPGTDLDLLARDLDHKAAQRLTDAERPRAIAYGDALPRNDMGKAMDWA